MSELQRDIAQLIAQSHLRPTGTTLEEAGKIIEAVRAADRSASTSDHTYIHLGIVGDPLRISHVFSDGRTAQAGGYTFHARHTNSGELDSFNAWCEPMSTSPGEPVHVIVTIPSEDVRNVGYGDQQKVVRSIVEALEVLVWSGWSPTTADYARLTRVCDYVVLTDPEDWTEQVEFVGRFA